MFIVKRQKYEEYDRQDVVLAFIMFFLFKISRIFFKSLKVLLGKCYLCRIIKKGRKCIRWSCSSIVLIAVRRLLKSMMRNQSVVPIVALSIISMSVAFILNAKGELLVCRRAKEPKKGSLDLAGGFIDRFETGEEGVAREVLEETGLDVMETEYLFSLPNTYLYAGFLVHTLDQFFLCRVKDDSRLRAMDDVDDSFWVPLQEVNPEEFGLDSVREGVKRFLREHNITK